MAGKKKTQSISDRTPPVAVEYDWGNKGQRRIKNFDDANEAKKFYAAKDKAGKKPKVLAATSNDKPAADKAPGVRAMRTRTYLAGVLIAKHGLAAGVTDVMIAELDELYGKTNPTESTWCLKNAWHACRAFAGVAEDAIK